MKKDTDHKTDKKKRPDLNELAKSIVDRATEDSHKPKRPARKPPKSK